MLINSKWSGLALSKCLRKTRPLAGMIVGLMSAMLLSLLPAYGSGKTGGMGVIGINHVTIKVSDLERSKNFYQFAAKLDAVAGPQHEQPATTAWLRSANGQLKLQLRAEPADTFEEPLPVQGPGITHICFVAPTEKPIHGRFMQMGATKISRGDGLIDLRGIGYMYGYLRDHDGAMIEVEQAPTPKFSEDVWLSHAALASSNLDRLVDFYRDLLGKDPYARGNGYQGERFDAVGGVDGALLSGAWFRVGNMVLELWQYDRPKPLASKVIRTAASLGHDSITFEVADIHAVYTKLLSMKAEVLLPPKAVGPGMEVVARDPDGNSIKFVELDQSSEFSVRNLKAIYWE